MVCLNSSNNSNKEIIMDLMALVNNNNNKTTNNKAIMVVFNNRTTNNSNLCNNKTIIRTITLVIKVKVLCDQLFLYLYLKFVLNIFNLNYCIIYYIYSIIIKIKRIWKKSSKYLKRNKNKNKSLQIARFAT